MMKRRFTLLTAALLLVSTAAAQQQPENRIALAPYVEYGLDRIPGTASAALERKLVSMATANGFAAVEGDFLLTAIPAVIDSHSTPTAPPQFVAEVEVALFVVNIPERIIVGQNVYTLKGVGPSQQKAVVNAIGQINVRGTDTRRFMEQVRTKLLDYYVGRLPSLIAEAQSLAARTRYEEALAVLAAVPESLPEYPQVAELMVDIYTDCIDRDATKILAETKALLAEERYSEALRKLVCIDPNSTLFARADAMITDIRTKLEAEKEAELQRELQRYEEERARAARVYEDSVELEKMKLKASREVAAKMASGTEGTSEAERGHDVVEWLLGNLI